MKLWSFPKRKPQRRRVSTKLDPAYERPARARDPRRDRRLPQRRGRGGEMSFGRQARAKSSVIRSAKSRLRLEQLRQHAAAGHTLVEAAEAISMKPDGARNLLRLHVGSSAWPPQ